MKRVHRPSFFGLLTGLVLLGLVAAACSPSRAASTPVVRVTQVATKAAATTAPTKAAATKAATTAATKAATTAATKAATTAATTAPTKAAATAAPTHAAPTTAPTLAPTKAAATPAPTTAAKPTPAPTQPAAKATPAPTQPPAKPTPAPTQPPAQANAVPVPLGFGLCVMPITQATATGISGDLRLTPSVVMSQPSAGADKPHAGNVFEVVRLEIQNQNDCAPAHFDPAQVMLLDPSSGKTYNLIALKSLHDELHAQDLAAGAKVSGALAFEAPATVKDWQMEVKAPDNRILVWQLRRPEQLGLSQPIGDLAVQPVRAQRLTASGTQKPKAGDVFELITVNIVNQSKTATAHFDPAGLLMLDPSSDATFSMMAAPSTKDQLQAHDLKPGEKLTGVALYEVPASAKDLQLALRAPDKSDVYWRLGG
jgi:outer membrane biosynthesis protein TonB